MKLQQLFDDVARHLLTQNEQALGANYDCKYRGEGGLRCAVGTLIPDHLYDSRMERNNVSELLGTGVFEALRTHLTTKYDVAATELDEFADALDSLQRLHDNIQPDQWPVQLEVFAKHFDLNYSKRG